MATTVNELKATVRPKSGKGAARAERRSGKVPGVIYGDNQPPWRFRSTTASCGIGFSVVTS